MRSGSDSLVFPFDHDHEGDMARVAQLIGGKGASLWAMTKRLGLPTPPGFTIPCAYSDRYDREGIADELLNEIESQLQALGERLGRRFGDPRRPLLLAVRSGAPVSMPGMMETVLNVGLTPDTLDGLATLTGSRAFALDSYRRFLSMFSSCVLCESPPELHATSNDTAALEDGVARLQDFVGERVGLERLRDAPYLLRETIGAVFRSRHSAPARAYRKREGLPESLGTAVTIQAMVFGNLDDSSGTGVAFSRDPSTGENRLTGDWMLRAQGEDVVAGIRATLSIDELEAHMPEVHAALREHADRLELWYGDMVDIEFTVEQGRLWVLQARVGKRSAAAATRIAVELAEDERFAVDRKEALRRVPGDVLRGERVSRRGSSGERIATGLGASPGTASGRVVLTPEAAIEAAETGEAVILVRRETSPADVHGMSAAVGILTVLGGLMSHAAVVARDWGLPAVVGAGNLNIDDRGLLAGDLRIAEGERISIDGASGAVFRGDIRTEESNDPYLDRLREWAKSEEAA